MTTILVLKLVHLIGAAVLFGTGLGIAFFMYMAHRTGDAALIAATARTVVIADAMFTLNAVIAQPVSGAALALSIGSETSAHGLDLEGARLEPLSLPSFSGTHLEPWSEPGFGDWQGPT